MSKGVTSFLIKFFSTKSKNLFSVQLGSALLLAQFGIVGVGAGILGFFLVRGLGLLVDTGIYNMDLMLDSIREGTKLADFEKVAVPLYAKTMAGKKSDAEKEKIRKEWADAIGKIGPVGEPPK